MYDSAVQLCITARADMHLIERWSRVASTKTAPTAVNHHNK
jgi:hypothetical protein